MEHNIKLAKTIREYWCARGYTGISVIVCTDPCSGLSYIKSNISVKGFPPWK